ncbi:MAG: chemotaxis protein CheX [Defluviitaleaceae bacterium]|nr:chemotaxis protein CheX [Defluviitaleaceae bacterium]
MASFDGLGDILADALAEAIATVTGINLEHMPDCSQNFFGEIIGAMVLSSKKSGILFISANEKDIRVLCSNMIGASEDEITCGDTEDTLCEFVNMTAGSAKLRLSDPDYRFVLSSPFIIRGGGIEVSTKSRTQVISKTLGNGEINIRIKFIC